MAGKLIQYGLHSFTLLSWPLLTDRKTDGETNTLASHGLEELFLQLCCCVSFSFSFWLTLFYSIPLLALNHRRTDRQRNEYTCFAWAGGTFSPVVLLCQFLVLAVNRFWCYILVWRVRNRYYNRKKSSSCLTGRCAIIIMTGKKSSSRLSGGCAIIITTGKKSSSHLTGGCAIIITTGKKVLVVCLASARSLLRPKKKSTSCLTGGCVIVITTGKKKI